MTLVKRLVVAASALALVAGPVMADARVELDRAATPVGQSEQFLGGENGWLIGGILVVAAGLGLYFAVRSTSP